MFNALPAALAALVASMTPDASAEQAAQAMQVHRDAIVIDGHVDTPSAILDLGIDPADPLDAAGCQPAMPTYDDALEPRADGNYCAHFSFPRAKAGGLDAAFLSLWVDTGLVDKKPVDGGGAGRRAIDLLDATLAVIAKHPDDVALVRTAGELRDAVKAGKFAALLGIEGGHAIEHSLAMLRLFHEKGVRYLTLTHSKTNDLGDSSGDAKDDKVKHHGGLSDFGRDVVREMNRLGMIVDVSHAADATFFDILETTKAPVIASHSSARALTPHWRNITDDMAKALAKNGGVVMINFNEPFIGLGPEQIPAEALAAKEKIAAQYKDNGGRADWEFEQWRLTPAGKAYAPMPHTRLVDHLDHLAKVAGWKHVGLGSDFDGVQTLPAGIAGVQDLPKISLELAKRGYTDEQITCMLGGNTLRVLAAVGAAADEANRVVTKPAKSPCDVAP